MSSDHEKIMSRSQEIGSEFLRWNYKTGPCPIGINDTYWFKRLCGLFETQAIQEYEIENLRIELKKERELSENEVMEIIAQVVFGESEKYFLRHANGQKYVRWGAVERDIRAIFNKGGKK